MTRYEAIRILDIVTQPGVSLTRQDYINIQIALDTITALAQAMDAIEAGSKRAEPQPKEVEEI